VNYLRLINRIISSSLVLELLTSRIARVLSRFPKLLPTDMLDAPITVTTPEQFSNSLSTFEDICISRDITPKFLPTDMLDVATFLRGVVNDKRAWMDFVCQAQEMGMRRRLWCNARAVRL
jgi:hypothetical protein